MNQPFISIIIPCRNEEQYIADCIESVLMTSYSLDFIELIIIDGMSSDNTVKIINDYINKYDFIKLFTNKSKTVPYALNLGIKQSIGDIIIRLDAHAIYPSDYISKLITSLDTYHADNVGGICLTDVKNKTQKTNSIKSVLSDKFGVGNSLFRIGVNKITESDTVPFGCFKKDVFTKYGNYNIFLTRNQDIELNKRIKNGGGKIYLIPDVTCTYYAREAFHALFSNNFQNGYWNILTVFYTKNIKSLSIRHFIPLAFILSIILPLILSIFFHKLIWLSACSLALYSLVVIIRSLKLTKTDNSIMYLILSFFILHLSYGVGSFCGLFKIIQLSLKREKKIED